MARNAPGHSFAKQHTAGYYIGGATPSFSTTTRCATNVPCAAGVATTNTFLPGVRSVRAAGAEVTIGTFCGRVAPLLPPLYDSFRSRPLVPSTTVSTFALV